MAVARVTNFCILQKKSKNKTHVNWQCGKQYHIQSHVLNLFFMVFLYTIYITMNKICFISYFEYPIHLYFAWLWKTFKHSTAKLKLIFVLSNYLDLLSIRYSCGCCKCWWCLLCVIIRACKQKLNWILKVVLHTYIWFPVIVQIIQIPLSIYVEYKSELKASRRLERQDFLVLTRVLFRNELEFLLKQTFLFLFRKMFVNKFSKLLHNEKCILVTRRNNFIMNH